MQAHREFSGWLDAHQLSWLMAQEKQEIDGGWICLQMLGCLCLGHSRHTPASGQHGHVSGLTSEQPDRDVRPSRVAACFTAQQSSSQEASNRARPLRKREVYAAVVG